jgi:hypothetical protein
MAVAEIRVETTHRNWTDVIKFPGRFIATTIHEYYDDPAPSNYRTAISHKIVWAPVAPALATFEPFGTNDRGMIIVKNLHHTDRVVMDTVGGNTGRSILAGHTILYPNIDRGAGLGNSITLQSTTGNACECEVVIIGTQTLL